MTYLKPQTTCVPFITMIIPPLVFNLTTNEVNSQSQEYSMANSNDSKDK